MNQDLISSLVPFNAFNHYNLELLAKEAVVETLQAGTHLFAQGDEDDLSVYLLSGEVMLTASDRHPPRVLVGGSASARYPLAQLKPRQYSGLATTPVTILRVDSKLIDRLLSWDQIAAYEITEFESSEDLEWMMRLLHSKAFHELPTVNANALFRRFQTVQVKAGQIIIRQGEPGDYYYVVKVGTADVVRKIEKSHKVSIIDQITAGEGFGEDALLTGAPRNATVVMVTDGVLMRLSRIDFDELLRVPLVHWLELEEARALVKAGAVLLDVRVEDEFLQGTIKGSINLPLYLLRKRAEELEPGCHYVVFCQTGSRSGAAAFLLTQRGFLASALHGGINALRQHSS
jgi:CRP-like cAMP-binding protein